MPHRKNLDAWDIDKNDFPHNGSEAEKLKFCLNYAILAPSTYNTQPWYFRIEGDTVSLYADRRYGLPVVDPDDRQLMISCGSALYALRLAIRTFGYEEHTQILPNPADPDLIANVQLGEKYSASEEEQALFTAITERQFNRGAFSKKEISSDVLGRLKSAVTEESGWLHVCEGDERNVVAHFIAEGDHMQMSNKGFRRELAAWIDERRYISGDGMPNYARNVEDMTKLPKPRIVRRFEAEPSQVVQDDQILDGCPVLAILGVDRGASRVNRLHAGQAFMKLLLQAEVEGLSVSTLNQACEVPELRLRLHDEIQQDGRAHIVLRFGYADRPVNFLPRRPLEMSLNKTGEDGLGRPANDLESAQGLSLWDKFHRFFLAK